MPQPPFDPQFIALQVHFAARGARLSRLPLAEALLRYTNLFVRFGAGRSYDANHPLWESYLRGLAQARDPQEYSAQFYLANAPETSTAPATVARFGCFAYAEHADPSSGATPPLLRLHFRNEEDGQLSPFDPGALPRRKAELHALLGHALERHGPTAPLLGSSWLYELAAYRSLFAAPFVERLQVVPTRPQSMSSWGQFLSHRRTLKSALSERFKKATACAETIEQLLAGFPRRTWSARATLSELTSS